MGAKKTDDVKATDVVTAPTDEQREISRGFSNLLSPILICLQAGIDCTFAVVFTAIVAESILPSLGVYLLTLASVNGDSSIITTVVVGIVPELFCAMVFAAADVMSTRALHIQLTKVRKILLDRAIIWYAGAKINRAKKKLTDRKDKRG